MAVQKIAPFKPADALIRAIRTQDEKPMVLLILNQPIINVKVPGVKESDPERDLFQTLWDHCEY